MESQLVAIFSFAGIAAGTGAFLLGFRDLFRRRNEDNSLRALIRRFPARPTEQAGSVAKFDLWLARTLYLSGLSWSLETCTLLLIAVGLAIGAFIFVALDNLLLASAGGMLGVVGVIGAVIVVKNRRLQKLQTQFPDAVDLLARASRAGESLEQAAQLVGKTMSEPVATEFRRFAGHLELGLSVQAAANSLSERTGLLDVKIFASAITVHRESGGNLPEHLSRLATVIRDRFAYHRQLKTATGSGKMSAIVISALGPILFVYLFFFQPEYGGTLLEDPTGRILLIVAAVLQVIGMIWVARLLKPDF